MTTFRRGDRVRCVASTADVLGGWELRGTLGTVVDVATVEPGILEGWEEVWVWWVYYSVIPCRLRALAGPPLSPQHLVLITAAPAATVPPV